MNALGPYSRAVALPAGPVINNGASDGASLVRRETRNGLIYVIGPDGIAQPCASERIADRVEISVRNLGRATV